MVRISGGKWHCRLCGVELNSPRARRPRTMIVGASGRANVRVLSVDGVEIHRCPSNVDVLDQAAPPEPY